MSDGRRRIRVIGIGAGHPDQVTVEAVEALRSVDYFITADKGDDDPLLAAREALLARHLDVVPPVVAVRDPERDRAPRDYDRAVVDWHDARASAYEEVLLEREGDAGFLVWGDPAFYDSTIRIVQKVLARGTVDAGWDVVPGISSLQMLAARHRIVLHEIGQPIVVTTGRRLREAIDSGADNVLVMLNAGLDELGSVLASRGEDWLIWWGANLGTPDESLVAGRVADVLPTIQGARDDARSSAGWVMDVYLLRLA
ncbi:precorrin-6A synthase (deacetylating) [Aeromicrobium chenweiae]|uniref:Precorrin-6A synthase (Deacetylating) n=1 Tax=Aeromicrobium chenweiae TaxID=2079793 RepID=A0A2S0WQX2_9ACTN|nr:precorrin-6A synthase (deacetylating) [Aeromicrobium chenweiae]AWB93624.1 precorrin-6A synthase (deacetylating) [Aeromicrobium chenweiae]TGN33272.1 precorrin-6A synthase (deacetylating) [Aeromicrobium chenweiae]